MMIALGARFPKMAPGISAAGLPVAHAIQRPLGDQSQAYALPSMVVIRRGGPPVTAMLCRESDRTNAMREPSGDQAAVATRSPKVDPVTFLRTPPGGACTTTCEGPPNEGATDTPPFAR